MIQARIIVVLTMCAGVLQGCNRLNGNSFVPALPGFEGERQQVLLKRPLREISGIDYVGNEMLAAVNDEAGKLFFVNYNTGKFTVEEFGKKGDYEDVVRVDDHYFVLDSDGNLFEISGDGKQLLTSYRRKFGKFVEFESIFYDRPNGRLVMICKECGKAQNSINGYSFDLANRRYNDGEVFSISWSDIRQMAKDNSIECKPSAAAINPANGKLYIIASLGKVLLQCTVDGKLEAVYGLNPDHFPQPEGITFSPEGDLFIANEGIQGKGTLLKFTYGPAKAK